MLMGSGERDRRGPGEQEEVRAHQGERRAPTDFGRHERLTNALTPGVRRVVQAGGGGFTISVVRTRIPFDGPQGPIEGAQGPAPVRETWTMVYRPQQRIVEVGAAPAPVETGPVAPGPTE
jgi:hypothetical protein